MAMRRPRVKVAANLSIRRPAKLPSGTGERSSGDVASSVKVEPPVKSEIPVATATVTEEVISKVVEDDEPIVAEDAPVPAKPEIPVHHAESKPVPDTDQTTFKFPKPVEEPPRITTPAPMPHPPLEVNTDEPHSPKKLDSKFAYINALNSPRKRIRTESMTSNKSYSDVSLKSRKTIKQEVSQKASDARRDLRKRLNNIQNIDKQSLTMFDMIYYNPVKNPMKSPALSKKGSLENIPHTVDREARSISKSRSPTPAPMRTAPMVPDPPKPTIQLTPQLKLGPNGEMILDETSLVVENEREREMRDTLAKTEIIYDDEFSGNSGYYSRYKRTKDWPPEETIRFYRCLHTIGTDFSMMIQLFPNRTRRDLKLKFKKEEKLNLMLVNKALLYPKEFNIEDLKQQFEEEDEQLERQREQERLQKQEAEEKLLQQKLAKKMQINQNKNRNPKKRVSKAARVMLDGERLVKAEPLMKESKPRRKRRKPKTEPASDSTHVPQQQPEQEQGQPAMAEEIYDGDVFDEVGPSTPAMDESDHEQQQQVNVGGPETYVPHAEFRQPGAEPIPMPVTRESSTLDIAAMDISIVDEESRSLYEIKAEPKVQPVHRYDTMDDAPTVITIQNLDDQSQTTMVYQEPTVTMMNDQAGIDSIESKYYGGCDVVYFPVPADAPIAHPVKTEPVSRRPQSPPLQYELLPLPDRKPTVQQYEPEPEQSLSVVEEVHVEADASEQSEQQAEEIFPDFPEAEPAKLEQVPEEEPPLAAAAAATAAEEEEEPRGLGPLEDIDINSLVLVESQDTQNPGRTIYEIYVSDPETGKLSEKPLDVPEDVIENIRSILEVGED